MRFDIITAFPNAFSFLNESIPKRAQQKGKMELNIVDLRKFSDDKWGKIDDRPFGGGAGMVLKVEPIYKALKSLGLEPVAERRTSPQPSLKGEERISPLKVLLMGARGKTWNQQMAKSYSENLDRVVIICGHYEGVDERVVEYLIDEEISIGNYILSGGELASMVIVDSVTRLLDGVVSKEESILRETEFYKDYKEVEYPHYTRPEIFINDEGEEWGVPEILLSGDHGKVDEWREDKKKILKG